MPIYDYGCKKCDKQIELHQSIGTPPPSCLDCGTTMNRRILFAPAVHGRMARGRELAMKSLPKAAHGKGCPCCT